MSVFNDLALPNHTVLFHACFRPALKSLLTHSLLRSTGQTVTYNVTIANTGNCKVAIDSARLTLPGGSSKLLTCPAFVEVNSVVTCTLEALTVNTTLFSIGTLQASALITYAASASSPPAAGDVKTASAVETVTAKVSAS